MTRRFFETKRPSAATEEPRDDDLLRAMAANLTRNRVATRRIDAGDDHSSNGEIILAWGSPLPTMTLS